MLFLQFFLNFQAFLGIFALESSSEPEFFEINIDRDHPEKVYQEFVEFKKKFSRTYKSEAENQLRLQNFVKSRNNVVRLNKNAQKAGRNSNFAVNQFSDLTTSELHQRLSRFPPNLTENSVFHKNFKKLLGKTRTKRQNSEFARNFDLRSQKVNGRYIVGPIKNQGQCACCWGFAVTAMLETIYAVNVGRFKRKLDYHFIRPENAESEIIEILNTWKTPVAVYFAAGTAFLQYKSGVLVTEDCDLAGTVWHAGAIVGYGEENDLRGRSQRFWIMKNSWGVSGWGTGGYVKLIRGKNWCGIERGAIGANMEEHYHG
ncbi:Pept_C1 domain-containing protein [Caenorhabditis elegans]|uniref:Pept_C1 domain-containing protein n=1 Tax=Caenorhabditis elegans TaxID=6239 RepID=O62484_CAEEL|nr:Pept_C1 domain-containing protein [Caenorhabditis elegans]CAA16404.3 Pept_C1 domain-containing protein [Caenorhabditis elegans]|eukprot:NP_001256811.1 Uncharacterized protein CELE_Y51A2D.1 [Caenorhabditis elegans]